MQGSSQVRDLARLKTWNIDRIIVFRAQFRKNSHIKDIRVIDMLVVQVRSVSLSLSPLTQARPAGTAGPEGGGRALEADHPHHGQVVP